MNDTFNLKANQIQILYALKTHNLTIEKLEEQIKTQIALRNSQKDYQRILSHNELVESILR